MGGERQQVVSVLSFYIGPQVEWYALLLLIVMEQHFSPWIEHLMNVFPTRLYLMYLPMLNEEELQVASPRVNEKQQSDMVSGDQYVSDSLLWQVNWLASLSNLA